MIYIIALICLLALYKLVIIAKFCNNPYKVKLIVGSKGSGKSLLTSLLASEFIGNIYSNMSIGYPLDMESYWTKSYPYDSLLIIDEAAVYHSNRDFKSMQNGCIEFYKMARKNHLNIILTSQTMDIDKKIRDLCDDITVCTRLGPLVCATPYKACISMVTTAEGGHSLENDVKKAGFPRLYWIPEAVRKTDKLGYDTDQMLSKDGSMVAGSASGEVVKYEEDKAAEFSAAASAVAKDPELSRYFGRAADFRAGQQKKK